MSGSERRPDLNARLRALAEQQAAQRSKERRLLAGIVVGILTPNRLRATIEEAAQK